MKKLPIVVLVLVLLSFSFQVQATQIIGPKAFGMGGAFTAVADDASSLYWNPAGLTRSGFMGAEVSLGFSTTSLDDVIFLVEGLTNGAYQDIIGSIQNEFNGRLTAFVGANLKGFSGGIIVNEDIRLDPLAAYSYRTSEKIGNIGVGMDLIKPVFNLGRISLGTNFKIIQRDEYKYTFSNGEFTQYGEPITEQELGVDVGTLVRLTDIVNLSLVARNMKLTLKSDNPDNSEWLKMPESVTVGAALKIPFPLKATIAADLEHNFGYIDPVGNEIEPINMFHLGFEKGFLFNLISIRAGAYGPISLEALGEDEVEDEGDSIIKRAFQDKITYTAGLGVNVFALHANAALGVSNDMEDLHATISASMKF